MYFAGMPAFLIEVASLFGMDAAFFGVISQFRTMMAGRSI
jgi:hypothetical protein